MCPFGVGLSSAPPLYGPSHKETNTSGIKEGETFFDLNWICNPPHKRLHLLGAIEKTSKRCNLGGGRVWTKERGGQIVQDLTPSWRDDTPCRIFSHLELPGFIYYTPFDKRSIGTFSKKVSHRTGPSTH